MLPVLVVSESGKCCELEIFSGDERVPAEEGGVVCIADKDLLGHVVSSPQSGRLGAVDVGIPIGVDGRLLNVEPTAEIISQQNLSDVSHVSLPVNEVADAVDAV
jgi:hypothetical protein